MRYFLNKSACVLDNNLDSAQLSLCVLSILLSSWGLSYVALFHVCMSHQFSHSVFLIPIQTSSSSFTNPQDSPTLFGRILILPKCKTCLLIAAPIIYLTLPQVLAREIQGNDNPISGHRLDGKLDLTLVICVTLDGDNLNHVVIVI